MLTKDVIFCEMKGWSLQETSSLGGFGIQLRVKND